MILVDSFQSDLQINEQLKKFTPNPVLVIIQAVPKVGAPIQAYIEMEEDHGVSWRMIEV